MSLQLKITLDNSKPPIWRRILVPDSFSFHQLHLAIQASMGWQNAHLYAFNHPKKRENIGIPDPEWDDDTLEAKNVLIRDELHKVKQKMTYEYDFGDGWVHSILLEDITGDKILNPIGITGKGACPPEDCGGLWGYYNLLKRTTDPKDPEYEDLRHWLGLEDEEQWDPAAFDLKEFNERVRDYLEWDQEFEL